jgi:hypothetical protein
VRSSTARPAWVIRQLSPHVTSPVGMSRLGISSPNLSTQPLNSQVSSPHTNSSSSGSAYSMICTGRTFAFLTLRIPPTRCLSTLLRILLSCRSLTGIFTFTPDRPSTSGGHVPHYKPNIITKENKMASAVRRAVIRGTACVKMIDSQRYRAQSPSRDRVYRSNRPPNRASKSKGSSGTLCET